MEARPRPFVDTNVLFSGFYNPSGAPAAILERHTRGMLIIVISRQVLDELVRSIKSKKPELLPLLHTFLTNAPPELVADPDEATVRRLIPLINATDAPILAAALQSRADCLVTGNTHHFTPEVARRVNFPILTPAAYLASLHKL